MMVSRLSWVIQIRPREKVTCLTQCRLPLSTVVVRNLIVSTFLCIHAPEMEEGIDLANYELKLIIVLTSYILFNKTCTVIMHEDL